MKASFFITFLALGLTTIVCAAFVRSATIAGLLGAISGLFLTLACIIAFSF